MAAPVKLGQSLHKNKDQGITKWDEVFGNMLAIAVNGGKIQGLEN
jgi:hypothetical protein